MIFLLLSLIGVDTVMSDCDPEVRSLITFHLNLFVDPPLQGGGAVQHHADDQLDARAVPQAVPDVAPPGPVVPGLGLLSLPASHALRDRQRSQRRGGLLRGDWRQWQPPVRARPQLCPRYCDLSGNNLGSGHKQDYCVRRRNKLQGWWLPPPLRTEFFSHLRCHWCPSWSPLRTGLLVWTASTSARLVTWRPPWAETWLLRTGAQTTGSHSPRPTGPPSPGASSSASQAATPLTPPAPSTTLTWRTSQSSPQSDLTRYSWHT